MKYLSRENSKIYHLFENSDTFCKLWSTGGMNKDKKNWAILENIPTNKNLCTMCKNNKNN